MKKTKAMFFEELKDVVVTANIDATQKNELAGFIDQQLELLENRKQSNEKHRQKAKEANPDTLTTIILTILDDTFKTVDDILAELEQADDFDGEFSHNKVTARLSKLVNQGTIFKKEVRIEGRRKMAYSYLDEAPVGEDERCFA